MKSLPSDPFAFQDRVFDAMFADMFDLGAGNAVTFRRLDALREVSKVLKPEAPLSGGE